MQDLQDLGAPQIVDISLLNWGLKDFAWQTKGHCKPVVG